jgi:drug/metabolite transporter (DMT)-like permease
MFIEQPWNLTPRLDSTISLIYLGVFSTGIAWLLRFYILKKNGLVFQAQVAYLIPIFGVILGFIFLKEEITSRVAFSLLAVILGIYLVKRSTNLQVLKKKKKFI